MIAARDLAAHLLPGVPVDRVRIRAPCNTLDAVDQAAAATGDVALTVLVVRKSDRLPGQGWWLARSAGGFTDDWPWTGEQARALVAAGQARAVAFWPDA